MTGRRTIRLLIVLGVLVVLLLVADRVASVYAGKSAARYLDKRADFASSPTVDIHGFPFLTQAFSGRYRDVEIRSGTVTVGSVRASSLDVHLHGAHLPLSDAFGGTITSLPVDSITGTVSFSYPELVQLSKIPDLSLSESHGELAVTATLMVPGSGITAPVSGRAAVSVVGDAVRLNVSDISVAGLSLPAAALAQLEAALAVPIPIPALPFGLVVQSVTATANGVVITGSASQVVISAAG
jgi:LmeA-like phospholipid-binding